MWPFGFSTKQRVPAPQTPSWGNKRRGYHGPQQVPHAHETVTVHRCMHAHMHNRYDVCSPVRPLLIGSSAEAALEESICTQERMNG